MTTAQDAFDALIGRERELAQVGDAIAEHRLVSLTGPGGSGKTRLALAALGASVDETAFVDASPLSDTSLLAPTILATVASEPAASVEPIAAIGAHFGTRRAVLALDNLEQLDGANLVIRDILDAAPRVTVLVTSRIPMRLAGEHEIAVPPLALPDGDNPAAVETSPAGALFLARARSVGRLARLAPADAAAIATLCRRLDGLPLAIELAAARTRILSPTELVSRIARLGISAIDPAPGGRRSMTAILDWTVGLLDRPQRETLEASAACEGFDLDLLDAVVGGRDASAQLEELVAMGLVSRTGVVAGRTRFRLLDLIREHVRRGMAQDAETRFAEAHGRAMVARTDEVMRAVDNGEIGRIAELELDIDNNRRALAFLAQTDPDAGLRLWRLMHPVWSNGRLLEAIEAFDRLRDTRRPPTVELVRSLPDLSRHVTSLRGAAAGHAVRVEAAELASALGDDLARAGAMSSLAEDALLNDDIAEAERIAATLADLLDAEDVDARLHAGEALGITYVAIDGPLGDRAPQLFAELAQTARTVGRKHMLMSWLGNLAFLELCRGSFDASIRASTEALEAAPGIDHNYRVIQLGYLAIALAAVGRADEAVARLSEAIATEVSVGEGVYTSDLLRAAAAVEVAQHRPLDAARLAGAATAHSAAIGEAVDAGDRLLLDRTLTSIRRQAREIDVELALRDGAAANASLLVRELPAHQASTVVPASKAGAAGRAGLSDGRGAPDDVRLPHGELTRREVEVLALVGQGKSDPEIAEMLFISPKTASVHVANIKGKLGVDSRLEVALRARDLGLG